MRQRATVLVSLPARCGLRLLRHPATSAWLRSVCLLHRCPFCSPAHRRIGSGCCDYAPSARSAFTFSARLHSTPCSCSHPCPHHCSRPWPDGSGPRARSNQVNHPRCTGSGSPRGVPATLDYSLPPQLDSSTRASAHRLLTTVALITRMQITVYTPPIAFSQAARGGRHAGQPH